MPIDWSKKPEMKPITVELKKLEIPAFIKPAVVTTALIVLLVSPAIAAINEVDAVHAILGESRDQGYKGMYAVACAIRNRGTLKGVHGAKANVNDASPKIIQEAYKAWSLSEKGPDVTFGATNFLSDYDIRTAGHKADWRFKMKETAYIFDTHFYMEKKRGL